MNWAASHIERLKRGEVVQFRPRGGSMTGRIENEQLVTVVPVGLTEIEVNDIVLVTIGGWTYVHLVKAIGQDGRYLIGNNRGRINGWAERRNVHGRVTAVEP